MRILGKTFQSAMKGNMRALELSLINRAGWSNRPELVVNVSQHAHTHLPLETPEIKAKLAAMHQLIRAEALADGNGDQEPPDRFKVDGLEGLA
jgi:hypothetical protein